MSTPLTRRLHACLLVTSGLAAPVGLATPAERIRMTLPARSSFAHRQAAGFPPTFLISSSTGATDVAIASDRHDSAASKPGALLQKPVCTT